MKYLSEEHYIRLMLSQIFSTIRFIPYIPIYLGATALVKWIYIVLQVFLFQWEKGKLGRPSLTIIYISQSIYNN